MNIQRGKSLINLKRGGDGKEGQNGATKSAYALVTSNIFIGFSVLKQSKFSKYHMLCAAHSYDIITLK